jgi:hemerythrin-like domain-containing protein
MHSLLERLHRDHINLARLLDLLERELNEFYAGRESDFDLVVEMLEYIECYAELIHHPTEDRIFEAAQGRLGDKQALLEKLHQQHGLLVGLSKKFRRNLEGVVQGAVIGREELEIEGREFIALQRQHLDLEEQEMFPALDASLETEDWERIAGEVPKHDDPVFGERDPNRFRLLYQYLNESTS